MKSASQIFQGPISGWEKREAGGTVGSPISCPVQGDRVADGLLCQHRSSLQPSNCQVLGLPSNNSSILIITQSQFAGSNK